ncbi:MAG TPA: glycoside hydrolase domain-containing protein [Longimicrobium sp.]|jgi:hypothetical protein|nr:glycoside hydrolase domain-containing protein [Longimicrobium sp.]
MPLTGTVQPAPAGALGLDFNADGQHMTTKLAAAFRQAGYEFCLRYVPREDKAVTVGFDLRAAEADFLLDAGFALMAVQHFKSEQGWTPSGKLGRAYGEFAASWVRNKVGFPDGVCLFCDLEAVASGTPTKDILDYCLQWHEQVDDAGYAAGLYLGDRSGLSGKTIADHLPFEHYWLAFNEDFKIPGHGFQMKQIAVGAASPLRPAGAKGFRFDADKTQQDEKGGTLRWLKR